MVTKTCVGAKVAQVAIEVASRCTTLTGEENPKGFGKPLGFEVKANPTLQEIVVGHTARETPTGGKGDD